VLTKLYSGVQIKNNEMAKAYST